MASVSEKDKKDEDLSEEVLALDQKLELIVERVQDSDPQLQRAALESLRQEIWSSTSYPTSVPEPLNFFPRHYGTLKEYYETMEDSDLKKFLADILSVIAMTMSAEEEQGSLKYKLLGSKGDIGSWGHEYIRNLAREITQKYEKRLFKEEDADQFDAILELAEQIVAFSMQHKAEYEAVDLSLEVRPMSYLLIINSTSLSLIHIYVQAYTHTHTYVCISTSCRYLAEGDDLAALEFTHLNYLKFEDYSSALRVALFADNMQHVKQIFMSCNDRAVKAQLCFIIARHGITFELDEEMAPDDDERAVLQYMANNRKLSEGYLLFARAMKAMEPKSPEDIYEGYLLDGRASAVASVDSARQNLAATFVNAFVNAGFCRDTLMIVPGGSGNWVFKNKEHGKFSAAASLGMILLWNAHARLHGFFKYLHSNDKLAFAGALLGIGVANCNVKRDSDFLHHLLECVNNEDSFIRIGAIMGLGIAYAGAKREEILNKLAPILEDNNTPPEVAAFAAISLGLVYVGSGYWEIAVVDTFIDAIEDRSDSEFGEPLGRFWPLGLGLVFLGKKNNVRTTARYFGSFNEEILKSCCKTLSYCAYAGSGDVIEIKHLLGECARNIEKNGIHQENAVLGIAIIAMGEEVGLEMAIRLLEHLSNYGKQNIRRAVPLALALLCISNPKVNVVDKLSRLSHDTDIDVAMGAIISLGLIGAGTNDGRIAGMLSNLLGYYCKEESLLFCVQIAQGLLHLGKGLLTLSPHHSDRFLLSPKALAGIITVLHACLDMKGIILGKYHFVLYFLVLAMQPRMLVTMDDNFNPWRVPVRVGQGVDASVRSDHPKTITGSQVLPTPALLATRETAKLATERFIPLSPILEGFVLLQRNPKYPRV
ncbi:hypothetical protein NMG60_11019313 [Bertholletia excelsa]